MLKCHISSELKAGVDNSDMNCIEENVDSSEIGSVNELIDTNDAEH